METKASQITAVTGTYILSAHAEGLLCRVPVIGWHLVEVFVGTEKSRVVVEPITVDGSDDLDSYDLDESETAILHPCGIVQVPLMQDFKNLDDWIDWVELQRGWNISRKPYI